LPVILLSGNHFTRPMDTTLTRRFINGAQGLDKAAGQFDALALKQQNAEDDRNLLEVESAVCNWKQTRLFDPKEGAYTKRGKNAFGLNDALGKDWQKSLGKSLMVEICLFKGVQVH